MVVPTVGATGSPHTRRRIETAMDAAIGFTNVDHAKPRRAQARPGMGFKSGKNKTGMGASRPPRPRP